MALEKKQGLPKDFSIYTPVMRQYLEERSKLPEDTVLLFRMGDFYESFFDDAVVLAEELDITLTRRSESNHPGGKLPMAGVPSKAVKSYIAKLLAKSYRVCIAEQMADPKTCKGLVPREVVQTYTPGTISELDLLTSFANNFILSIFICKDKAGLAYADVSTGEFYISQVNTKQMEQEIFRISPKEIIVPAKAIKKEHGDFEKILVSCLDVKVNEQTLYEVDNFNTANAYNKIKSTFTYKQIPTYISESYDIAINAAGALLSYLQEHQPSLFETEQPFDTIKTYNPSDYMLLDISSRKNLEISQTLSGDKKSSLFASINKTSANFAKRRLLNWLENPLVNLDLIQSRQNAIEEIISYSSLVDELTEQFSNISDLERLCHRLYLSSISPRELKSLKDSLKIICDLSINIKLLESNYAVLVSKLPESTIQVTEIIENSINETLPLGMGEGKIFKFGYHSDLDELIDLVENGDEWLDQYESQLRESLGIKSLKVQYNKVHGYFIEVSKANQNLVPEYFTCKQTMVNNVRYISPELKEFEVKRLSAESRRTSLEVELFNNLRAELVEYSTSLKTLANNIADFAVIVSLAKLALEHDYIRPTLDNNLTLDIQDGRHPVIEQRLALGEFIANDYQISDASNNIMLLTGPNMAGKSTFMRQNALIILLAQIGSYVPARKAHIGIVDRIFTRIGASDDLASGRSTFMVEMNEVAGILNSMTEKSFLILDEIGRGTSTFDGVSIAWSIVEYLEENGSPRTIFATHYHELSVLENMLNTVSNYQVLVSETRTQADSIVFLHKVGKSSANKSYGIEVAKLAGLPKSVLSRAQTINRELQKSQANGMLKHNQAAYHKSLGLNISRKTKDNDLDLESLPLFQLKSSK